MKLSLAFAFLLSIEGAAAFTPILPSVAPSSAATRTLLASSATEEATEKDALSAAKKTTDPLLIRAARGEKTERTPVWMMRQAGRHIAEYRDLCKEYPTFRQRSEIPEVAVEVSLQPWRNYQTDGCILFSDILTPFPGMGVDFQIDEKLGPVMEPMRNWDDIKKVRI
jgi:uroporphyrinogen decarboxylase